MASSAKRFGRPEHLGPFFVALAALLWGTDAIFRFPLAEKLDPTLLVFFEHGFGTLFLLAALLVSMPPTKILRSLKLGRSELFAATIVGVLGSASATVLFSASFKYVNPSIAILLQKLQPIFVVGFAYFILKEVPARKFFAWAGVALVAGTVLSFPDLSFDMNTKLGQEHFKGIAFALAASFLWAIATVWGKVLLTTKPILVSLFWRYALGFLTLAIVLTVQSVGHFGGFDFAVLRSGSTARSIWYLSVLSGILPLFLYYQGLARTRASVTTFIELLYPVTAILLNLFLLNAPLSVTQLIAAIALLFAVTRISV